MPERFPPIEAVRTRGAYASHEGGRREQDEQGVVYLADNDAAFASVLRGFLHARPGRPIADLILDHGVRMFRERTASMLDDLAELWWQGEHAGSRVRPFSSLPIGERAELRARVKRLLAERVPDALGDQAVLDGETKRLLAIPESALRRASADIERRTERDFRTWGGAGGVALNAIFAAGEVSIAHVGDCRALRLRRGILDQLTREHTLERDYEDAGVPIPADAPLPHGIFTRAIGPLYSAKGPDLFTSAVQTGDLYLFVTRGTYGYYDPSDLKDALRTHGVEAAPRLVSGAQSTAPENIAAVAVEIL